MINIWIAVSYHRGVGRGAEEAAAPPKKKEKRRERGERKREKKREEREKIPIKRERKLNQSFQEHVVMVLQWPQAAPRPLTVMASAFRVS